MIKTEPWTGGIDEEYETQHFGFGAQRLKISVRQMVEQKITDGVKDMESYLQNSLNLNDTDNTTLSRSCDKLIRLYCERAEPSLENIDTEIKRLLKVPQNVLLPGDECQSEQISDEDYNKLKEEVAALRTRVERGALMEALLKAEEEELSTVEIVCDIAKKDMETFDLLSKNSDNNCKSAVNETVLLCASVNSSKKDGHDYF